MNKIIILLIIATVGMACVSGFLFYQLNTSENVNITLSNHNKQLEQSIIDVTNQKNELENQLHDLNIEMVQKFIKENSNKIEITKFNILSISSHPPGVHIVNLSITIHNKGVNDVSDLLLAINFTTIELCVNKTIDLIHSGETITLKPRSGWGATSDFYKSNIIATLYAKDLLLDEKTLISPIDKYFDH